MAVGTGKSAGQRVLTQRRRNRRLPSVENVRSKEPGVNRALEAIAEHLRVYEGSDQAPKERFVTIQELEDAGLITAGVKNGYSFISQVLKKDVAQKSGSTANPSLKGTIKKDTALGARTPGGGGGGGGTNPVEAGKRGALQKLSDIANVFVAKPAQKDFLYFDGGQWRNFSLFRAQNRWENVQRFDKPMTLLAQAAGPAAVEDRGYLWVKDGSPTELWFTADDGTETQLNVAGGGLSDVVDDTSPQLGGDLDTNGFDITLPDNDFIYFGTGNDFYMSFDGTQLTMEGADLHYLGGHDFRIYDSADADYVSISLDGTDANITFSGINDLNFGGFLNRFRITSGRIALAERTNPSADEAGYGQIWVKDDAPTTLWFVDDVGGQHQLGVGLQESDNATITGNWTFDGQLRGTSDSEFSYGTHGGYSDNPGTNWAASIWSIDTAWAGGDSGSSWSASGVYGLAWIRDTHASEDALVGEGLYVFRAGTQLAGFGITGASLTAGGNGRHFSTKNYNSLGNTTGAEVRTHANEFHDVGLNVLPQFGVNTSDTLEARHCGHFTGKTNTTARTITLAASGDTDFPVEGVVTIANVNNSGNISINQGSGTTLRWCDGTGTTDGNRTLGPGGIATVYRYSTTLYVIWGAGLS